MAEIKTGFMHKCGELTYYNTHSTLSSSPVSLWFVIAAKRRLVETSHVRASRSLSSTLLAADLSTALRVVVRGCIEFT